MTVSPSTTASVRMGPEEIINKGRVQDDKTGDPRPLLRPITLPVHKKVKTLPPMPDVRNPASSAGGGAVDDTGGRRGRRQRAKWALLDRLN